MFHGEPAGINHRQADSAEQNTTFRTGQEADFYTPRQIILTRRMNIPWWIDLICPGQVCALGLFVTCLMTVGIF